jgi:hypothetical protein
MNSDAPGTRRAAERRASQTGSPEPPGARLPALRTRLVPPPDFQLRGGCILNYLLPRSATPPLNLCFSHTPPVEKA